MIDFKSFSKKQLTLLTWWCNKSIYKDYDAIICDGAVRSGKTLCMSISFVSWAFAHFSDSNFVISAKTITSLRRNVITPLLGVLTQLGFTCVEKLSKNFIDISYQGNHNRFYLFGGKDESSAALIQGITLSGIMFDEVALMPRSFVEQALARCSISGSKFWFNCNPEHPFHWFYTEWIKKAKDKNALYLHFLMKDNPSLSKKMLNRYQSLYTGTFYERFVMGKWVTASGLVYPIFDYTKHVFSDEVTCTRYYISCDYGTVNPTSMGLWGESDGVWHRLREFYYNSRLNGNLKTDEEYYVHLEELISGLKIEAIIVDPSAASFIECIKRHGKYKAISAKNEVISGIRRVSDALRQQTILFHYSCKDTIREFSLYSWENNVKHDYPKKENDHAMDDVRYFVNTVLNHDEDDFFVMSAIR